MKLKKGDKVKVIKGKDKGKTGKIERVLAKKNQVLVLGVNQYKRHLKARSQRQPSEIVTLTKPLSLTNVALVCPSCGEIARVGFKIEKDSKMRICKKCNKQI